MTRLMQPPGKREDSCMFAKISSDQNPGYLLYITCILMGILISHYMDPYKPISIMDCQPRVLLLLPQLGHERMVPNGWSIYFWMHFYHQSMEGLLWPSRRLKKNMRWDGIACYFLVQIDLVDSKYSPEN